MNCRFLPSAAAEFEKAVAYYDANVEFGDEFTDEVFGSIERICMSPSKRPRSSKMISKISRKCGVRGFPFFINYQIRKDEILITGLAQQAQTFFVCDPEC